MEGGQRRGKGEVNPPPANPRSATADLYTLAFTCVGLIINTRVGFAGGLGVRPPLQQPDPPTVWQYGVGGGASRPRLRGPRMTDPPTGFLTNPTL
jgi:hypothetical protein